MRIWRGRPAAELVVGFSAVLSLLSTFPAAVLAQDAPPVIIEDVDPLKECKRRDVNVFESENKVYMYGGLSWMKNGTRPAYQVLNNYLRIVDFTSPRSLSDRSIMTAKEVPGNITVFQYGAFWVDSKRAYIAGGVVQDEPWLSRDGKFLTTNYTSITGDVIFTYNTENDRWATDPAVQPTDGAPVSNSFCCGSFAYNAARRKAYFYSGTINDVGGRRQHPSAQITPYFDPPKPILSSSNMLVFDTATFKWSNVSLNTQTTTPGTDAAQFVYLPSTVSSGGGIGIVLGGRRRDTMNLEPLRKVLVYDSATDSWYNQATTTTDPGGIFPDPRVNFCASVASAPDNSSHNIYMYGGEAPTAIPNAYSDMWILSVPSFRWMRVNVNSEARKSVTCTTVGQRYMMTYGGIKGGWGEEGDKDQCDDENFGVRLFDMSNLAWTSQYEGPPAAGKTAYTVPKLVYDAIGGNEQGKATATAPSSGFDAAALTTIFQKASATSGGTNTNTSTSTSTPAKKSTNIGAIAGGVLGGLAVVILILIGALLFLKRKKKQQRERAAAEHVPLYQNPHQQQQYSTELPGHHVPEHHQQGGYKAGWGTHEIYSARSSEPNEMYAGDVPTRPPVPAEKSGVAPPR